MTGAPKGAHSPGLVHDLDQRRPVTGLSLDAPAALAIGRKYIDVEVRRLVAQIVPDCLRDQMCPRGQFDIGSSGDHRVLLSRSVSPSHDGPRVPGGQAPKG